ncbi:MAG: hypothetical protein ACT4QF_09555 [Sporichthyaceae bacterium]
MLLALLPSPLLGPAAWEPVAALLRAGGVEVVVPRTPSRPTKPAEVLTAFLDGLPSRPLLLVPHSNAGLYVPALAARRRVTATVFVDAALPGPDPTTPTCPPPLRALLASLADADGWLPPWTRWWDEADLAPLFPDAAERARIEAAQPRLPLAYFDSVVPTPALRHPCAYLAFGETYRDESGRALLAGWPAATIPDARHLHMVVDPVAVAETIATLLAELPAT